MAIDDLQSKLNQGGTIEVCYLVEPSARITNHTFKVWVPSVMGSVDSDITEQNTKINAKQNIGEGAVKPAHLQEKGYITAINESPYAYRYDGYIPHFKVAKMHIDSGSWTSGNGTLSGPTTPAGCGPHTHETTGTHQINNAEFSDMTLNGVDLWLSTEVDLQNINNKVMKKGHRMYGAFVNGGEPGEFVVFAISNVTPRFDATEESANADIPDKTIGGKNNPENTEMS